MFARAPAWHNQGAAPMGSVEPECRALDAGFLMPPKAVRRLVPRGPRDAVENYDRAMNGKATVARRGYAKLNLALAVGPALPQGGAFAGYHPIASWMASVDLFDDVVVERLSAASPSRYAVEWADDAPRPSPIDWALEKDLAVRAHRLLEAEAGRALPVSMTVRKRIPVGGGMGGGSADAAAALTAIRELLDLPIPATRLGELAAKLGSDVAFFLDEETPARGAIVSSLGERIERVARVESPAVLFFPPFGCPTGAVYKAFDAGGAGEGFDSRAARVRRNVEEAERTGRIATDELFNDLTGPACRVEPRLREIIDRLSGELNAHVHVTGSGSTLFALAESEADVRGWVFGAEDAVPGVRAVASRVV
jgi:4-diphosphocytidyl-2-C-methyl-D-erythritol kinase